ncbi:MAG: translocation/assembly module TamB domain-containing protein, partial [Bacteroidales bacterium]|nr:translocation/assembly module TamB domain-containing protein [Bacteroidales bacterium]
KANSPSLKIQGIKFKNLNISILAQDRNLKLRTTLSHIYIKEPTKSDSLKVSLEKVLLTGEFSGDTIQYKFSWADHFNPKLNSGRVDGFLTFVNIPQVEFRITQSELMIGGDPWAFNHNNSVLFDTDTITIRNLALAGSNQKIKIEGKISPNPTDDLLATFEAFSISSLDPILYYYGIDVKGILSGSIGVNNVYDNPGLSANLVLNKTIFNSEPLGDLFVNATWNSTSESIWVNTHITYTGNIGTIVPLSLTGNYFPNKANNNLDFLLKVNNFKLQTLEPYVEGLFSNIQGLATGELAIKGPVSEPIVEGDLRLMRAEFRFDYTNISYSLADLIHFEKDRIYGNNIQVFDNFGNSGLCDVQVLHKNFDDFRLEVKITASNLAGLETDASQNSLFYGTAYVSGTVVVFGPLDDITIDLKLKSEPRTSITIPISYAVDVADNTFIIFNNPSGTLDTPIRKIESSSAVRMNMDLDVTRDADIQLFLPYQMGNIQSTGNGKIKMHYNTNGDFTMYGDYFMHQGTFLFTLKNFINRPFVLQKGGVIRWSGSPYDAEIDLSAIYKLKVNLNGLPNISEEFSNRRFPVDCVLKLKNNLMDPDITFSLRMPNVDQNVQREVFSVIDTTNQVMLSRQVISLLLLGNFNFSVEQGNFATSLETSSFDLISSQLSNWISQISKDFDFGLNYRPEDELTPEELELALSTQLFDDRVLIDGNFLVGNRENQNASNVIGDINVEFLLTRDGRFRVRAFNKYNELDITRQETPYTQGVAFFYRREFNGINDLFRRRRKTPVEGEVVNNNKDGSLFLLPTNTELY